MVVLEMLKFLGSLLSCIEQKEKAGWLPRRGAGGGGVGGGRSYQGLPSLLRALEDDLLPAPSQVREG